MGEVKQINMKNQSYYFYSNIIGIKHFDAKLLKIDKNSYKDIGIYDIERHWHLQHWVNYI